MISIPVAADLAFEILKQLEGREEMATLLEIFGSEVETPDTVAFWLVSPQELLEHEAPVAWLEMGREPEVLYEAARRAVAKLAH